MAVIPEPERTRLYNRILNLLGAPLRAVELDFEMMDSLSGRRGLDCVVDELLRIVKAHVESNNIAIIYKINRKKTKN